MRSLQRSMIDLNMNFEGLNPLLPHIAGAIESLEEATFADIRCQVESDLGRKVSATALSAGLENGVILGVFNVEREFKVCREFTTKELKKLKTFGDQLTSGSKKLNALSLNLDKNERNMMEYVKREREERRKKMYKRRRPHKLGLGKDYERKNELSKYLCQRCKKSLEKELLGDSSSLASTESIGGEKSPGTAHHSISSSGSDASFRGGSRSTSRERNLEDSQRPEKSRLLVEKNPLETEPPYYDIFT